MLVCHVVVRGFWLGIAGFVIPLAPSSSLTAGTAGSMSRHHQQSFWVTLPSCGCLPQKKRRDWTFIGQTKHQTLPQTTIELKTETCTYANFLLLMIIVSLDLHSGTGKNWWKTKRIFSLKKSNIVILHHSRGAAIIRYTTKFCAKILPMCRQIFAKVSQWNYHTNPMYVTNMIPENHTWPLSDRWGVRDGIKLTGPVGSQVSRSLHTWIWHSVS